MDNTNNAPHVYRLCTAKIIDIVAASPVSQFGGCTRQAGFGRPGTPHEKKSSVRSSVQFCWLPTSFRSFLRASSVIASAKRTPKPIKTMDIDDQCRSSILKALRQYVDCIVPFLTAVFGRFSTSDFERMKLGRSRNAEHGLNSL